MSSNDRLSVLRERNKDLLMQLKQHRERLQRLGCTRSSEESVDETRQKATPEDTVTLIDGDRGPARAALAKPTVSFAENETSASQAEAVSIDTCKRLTSVERTISTTSVTHKHRRGTVDHIVSSELLKDGNRRPVVHNRQQETSRPAKSIVLDLHREQREAANRVTFQSPEWKEMSTSDSHHMRPLLGYDWIAGVLDVESSLIERSEEFFNDLLIFRSVNKEECVHSQQVGFSEEDSSVPLMDEDGPEAVMDTHQCTFCYRINSRLFPIPLDLRECCPVCKKPKSTHPHTTAEPAFIRVSIPRSTLLPAYKYKAHRRCSFDPSDSLGLPSHCLSGWSNTGQSTLPQPSSLDLRSSLNIKTSPGLPLRQPQTEEHMDLSVSRVSGSQRSDQILDVSRLARYRFQHLSPKSKLCNTSYPVY